MQHYFTSDPQSPHQERTLTVELAGARGTFATDAGVFSREGMDFGSRLLVETAWPRISGRVLDMGCGWGAMGVMLGLLCPGIALTMADVNQRAADLAARNARANGVEAQVLVSDGYGEITGEFDAIVTNPPIRAGKETVYRLLDGAKEHLSPGGQLILVIRKEQGAPSCQTHLQGVYGSVERLAREKGYWILACQAEG